MFVKRRILLVMLVVVLVIAAMIVWEYTAPSEQERAIADLRQVRGEVEIDESHPDKPVRLVKLEGTLVNDQNLSALKVLSSLQVLSISCPHVSDAGLVHLEGLSNLQELNLSGTPIT